MPIKITRSHTAVPKGAKYPPPHLSHTYRLTYSPGPPESRGYLIPRPDGGVICGGGKYTYVQDKKAWFDNYDDSTMIEQARGHFERMMRDNFKGWERSGAEVNSLWTGRKYLSSLCVVYHCIKTLPPLG